MKKYFLILGFILSFSLHSQTIKAEYVLTVNIFKPFEFPATVFANTKGERLYTVKYGIEEDEPSLNASGVSLTSKERYDYLLYYTENNNALIRAHMKNLGINCKLR